MVVVTFTLNSDVRQTCNITRCTSERGFNILVVNVTVGELIHTQASKTEPSYHSSIHSILLIINPMSLPQFTITIVHIVWSMARCGGE